MALIMDAQKMKGHNNCFLIKIIKHRERNFDFEKLFLAVCFSLVTFYQLLVELFTNLAALSCLYLFPNSVQKLDSDKDYVSVT